MDESGVVRVRDQGSVVIEMWMPSMWWMIQDASLSGECRRIVQVRMCAGISFTEGL